MEELCCLVVDAQCERVNGGEIVYLGDVEGDVAEWTDDIDEEGEFVLSHGCEWVLFTVLGEMAQVLRTMMCNA